MACDQAPFSSNKKYFFKNKTISFLIREFLTKSLNSLSLPFWLYEMRRHLVTMKFGHLGRILGNTI